MPTYWKTCLLVAVLFCRPALAGQITMKNGDRLTGAIVKFDGKNLMMKSEFAGSVTIPWEAVESLSSSTPLHVTVKGGQVLAGTVTTAGGNVEIRTESTGTVTTAKDAVLLIRSKEEETAYQAEIERLRNPGLLDLWSGFVDTGLALTRGNADTTTFNIGMNASRVTKRDKIGVFLTSLYGKSKATGRSLTIANTVRGGITYDFNITDRSFAFGLTNLEFDEFQKLDLRFVGGGGLGWHAVKTDRTAFDLFGGGSLNKEFFSNGIRRTSGELLFGEEFNHKLSGASSIREKLALYPNLTDSGQYRLNFDLSAVTVLKKWLGWQVTLSDRYLSNPIPGVKKNDTLLTTGLRLTFAR